MGMKLTMRVTISCSWQTILQKCTIRPIMVNVHALDDHVQEQNGLMVFWETTNGARTIKLYISYSRKLIHYKYNSIHFSVHENILVLQNALVYFTQVAYEIAKLWMICITCDIPYAIPCYIQSHTRHPCVKLWKYTPNHHKSQLFYITHVQIATKLKCLHLATKVTKDQMVITFSFYLSKEGVSRVYLVKLGNKNLENDDKVKLLIWYKDLGMDNYFPVWKRCCCEKP